MTPLMKRVAWGVGALAVLVYAIEGGEYGTSDLLTQRDRKAALAQNVDMLAEDVDSLRAELKAVTSDPVRLERMAREEWGMVRGEKELLYRMRTDTSRAP
ncbi:septum formation initiator family protein [Gemmatimonas sp.]|uniref:FtsB family cell division protein n=1 Tax=Gemmatimonas sp. TaxID=1962908 RepID=UPI00286D03C1|nr:septum formation initiator family protein [Gemmatimonas sp.]